jgi:elongation factor Ts
MVTAELVKELRSRTSAGYMDCKHALEEASGNLEKAIEILRIKGAAKAAKVSGRQAREGTVASYIHFGGGRIGTLVELNCETDFVARNEEFRALSQEIAMQIAAGVGPRFVSPEEVAPDILEREKAVIREQALIEGKPEKVVDRIVEGRLKTFYEETCLTEMGYFRDPCRKVKDLLTEATAKFGERILIRRFSRFEVGSE